MSPKLSSAAHTLSLSLSLFILPDGSLAGSLAVGETAVAPSSDFNPFDLIARWRIGHLGRRRESARQFPFHSRPLANQLARSAADAWRTHGCAHTRKRPSIQTEEETKSA